MPKTNLKFASIAFVSGYLVKVVRESIDCKTCLSAIESTDCEAPLYKLIANQDRGGLFYPSSGFIIMVSVIIKIAEEAKSKYRRNLLHIQKIHCFFPQNILQ